MSQNFDEESICDKQMKRKNYPSKTLISRQIFVQQDRKKRRMHTNSILNELRLNQKINQQAFIKIQQNSLKNMPGIKNPFQQSKKSSIRRKSNLRLSQLFNNNQHQQFLDNKSSYYKQNQQQRNQHINLKSQFQIQKSKLRQKNDINEHENKQNLDHRLGQKYNDFQQGQKPKYKQKNQFVIKKTKHKRSKASMTLNSINNKVRQINLISKIFDRVNQSYNLNTILNQQKYTPKISQTDKILKDFESKLSLRKNLITQRKNSFKKNTKIQYRYKVLPKRFQTQFIQPSHAHQINLNNQNSNSLNQNYKIKGIWYEDAKKFKKYVTGGYTDQRQQFSDYYNIQEFRDLRKNFQIFQQIYNSIKQDKDNPIGKICEKQFKNPNLLEMVSVMEKTQQIDANNQK